MMNVMHFMRCSLCYHYLKLSLSVRTTLFLTSQFGKAKISTSVQKMHFLVGTKHFHSVKNRWYSKMFYINKYDNHNVI